MIFSHKLVNNKYISDVETGSNCLGKPEDLVLTSVTYPKK